MSLKRFLPLVAIVACGDASSSPSPSPTNVPSSPDDPPSASPTPPPAKVDPVPDPKDKPKGPPPSSLPVTFTRPDAGTPLTPAELATATDQLVALLADTHYFEVVDERVHGWPESAGGFWYGTWWSGVSIEKKAGKVTFVHAADGAENNGLRTAPYLEGACYAHLMRGDDLTASLVRRMTRGYSSWSLSMERHAGDEPMLSRSSYPANVTDTARSIFIDYSADRPGIDGNTLFVHIATNPTFGDVFVQNKRSKDDMGQIFRSLAQIAPCADRLDAAGKADVAQAIDLYAKWSRQVEADGWGIATLDQSLNVFMPPVNDTMAHYFDAIECPGVLMMRLAGDGSPGTYDCGTGVSATETFARGSLKSDALQILRTHHEAAVNWSLAKGQNAQALTLLQGLAQRLDVDVAAAQQPTPPSNVNPMDIVSLVLHAANTGVPLTSTEVRFVLDRLAQAYSARRSWRIADAADGAVPYDPGSPGMFFSDIGLIVGSCASPMRNPSSRPLVDCARLLAAMTK